AIGPKRTCACATHMSAFGGKADMTVCGNPLSRSLFGAKRTCLLALYMPAFDPKRTLADLHVRRFQCASLSCHDALVLSLGGGNETARVHYTSRRCGYVATQSACATVGKTADSRVLGRRHNVLESMDGCLCGATA